MNLYNLLLFAVTLAGGSLPLWFKGLSEKQTNYLLAFSGSFLLCITLLHLLPETFEEIGGHKAGLCILAGFFVQLIIQRVTHGMEHGHVHAHPEGAHHNHHHFPLVSILAGLSVHAFMEGIPLAFNYRMPGTDSSLYLAVAAHKLPEAMLLTTLVWSIKGRNTALVVLALFSLITPAAAILADMLGKRYFSMNSAVMWMIPIVAGAFIHIATTIFFESGTRQHMLTVQKIVAITLGVAAGLTTLLFE